MHIFAFLHNYAIVDCACQHKVAQEFASAKVEEDEEK
jgi:hypothetical protein